MLFTKLEIILPWSNKERKSRKRILLLCMTALPTEQYVAAITKDRKIPAVLWNLQGLTSYAKPYSPPPPRIMEMPVPPHLRGNWRLQHSKWVSFTSLKHNLRCQWTQGWWLGKNANASYPRATGTLDPLLTGCPGEGRPIRKAGEAVDALPFWEILFESSGNIYSSRASR